MQVQSQEKTTGSAQIMNCLKHFLTQSCDNEVFNYCVYVCYEGSADACAVQGITRKDFEAALAASQTAQSIQAVTPRFSESAIRT